MELIILWFRVDLFGVERRDRDFKIRPSTFRFCTIAHPLASYRLRHLVHTRISIVIKTTFTCVASRVPTVAVLLGFFSFDGRSRFAKIRASTCSSCNFAHPLTSE